MDFSRSIKRLAIIVAVAIIVILLSKSLLTRTVKKLGAEAEKKQQAKAAKPVSASVVAVPVIESPDSSAATQSSPIAAESANSAQ